MMVAVLCTLAVVAILAAALCQSLIVHLRQVRVAEQHQQSFWLAESAMQRALDRLSASREYRGETWNVARESLDGRGNGVVVIRVDPAKEPQPGVRVRVEARYPDDPAHRIVHQRERFVPIASQGASS